MNNTIEKDKEQVISYYQSFIDMCLDVHGIDLTTIISDCVAAGINHSQRWIPVQEELPPIATRVLVKDENGGTHVSYRGKGKDEWYLITYIPVSWRYIELASDEKELDCTTYLYDIDGRKISVTSEEVRDFYGKHHTLTEAEIEEHAGRYFAWIKLKRECNACLDKPLIQRLLDEEKLMKDGESDSFKLQLTFLWYVEILKETIDGLLFYIKSRGQ